MNTKGELMDLKERRQHLEDRHRARVGAEYAVYSRRANDLLEAMLREAEKAQEQEMFNARFKAAGVGR
jgi:hypothetical protein